MKPDAIARAHLRDPRDRSHVMHSYLPPAELVDVVQRFWIPVWSVPPGDEALQRVLQYPCALVVVTPEYARFYGVTSRLSTTTLTGESWAVGVSCQPAAGALVSGTSMTAYTDRFVDLGEVLGPAATPLVDGVRVAMGRTGREPEGHAAALDRVASVLRGFLPVDAEGLVVNELVAHVEEHPEVVRVAQLGAQFGLSERALQRLVQRRIGLTPKWLIQRRRLQEASVRLRARTDGETLADVAADLGYADQAHFTRDFQAVTGMTPGEFAARFGGGTAEPDDGVSRAW